MWGLIQRADHSGISALHDIAGRPLVARQLLWLRRIGCERIAIEVGPGPEGADLAAWLDGGDALCLDVVPVLSSRRLEMAELARRAGCPAGKPIVAIESDVVGDADPSSVFADATDHDVVVALPPPTAHGSLLGAIITVGCGARTTRRGRCAGWGVRIRDAHDAFLVACLALERSAEPEQALGALAVAGSIRHAGVIAGRGAVLEPGAIVHGPSWIGPGAIVRAGAEVEPFSVIGPFAVIERGARLGRTRCDAQTVVGEKLDVRGLDVSAQGVRAIDDPHGPRAALGDALMLDARPSLPRALASALRLLLAVLAAPLLFVGFGGDVRRVREALTDLASARRSLVGVGEPLLPLRGSDGLRSAAERAPRGLLDIEPVLGPPHADTLTRLRARAWYAGAKSLRLDALLALRLLRHAVASRRAVRAPSLESPRLSRHPGTTVPETTKPRISAGF